MTVERGVDPRGYALLAFGGAGPMHAARLAQELGITRVVCPAAAGVLSALGLATASRRRDAARTVLMSEADVDAGRAAGVAATLAEEAARGLAGPEVTVTWDVRYAGQAFELPVVAAGDAGVDVLRERFEAAHAERYGYVDPDGALEIVNLRASATARRDTPGQPPGGLPATAERVPGPAVLRLPEATVVVPPGWVATSDAHGAVLLDRDDAT